KLYRRRPPCQRGVRAAPAGSACPRGRNGPPSPARRGIRRLEARLDRVPQPPQEDHVPASRLDERLERFLRQPARVQDLPLPCLPRCRVLAAPRRTPQLDVRLDERLWRDRPAFPRRTVHPAAGQQQSQHRRRPGQFPPALATIHGPCPPSQERSPPTGAEILSRSTRGGSRNACPER